MLRAALWMRTTEPGLSEKNGDVELEIHVCLRPTNLWGTWKRVEAELSCLEEGLGDEVWISQYLRSAAQLTAALLHTARVLLGSWPSPNLRDGHWLVYVN